MKFPTRQTYDQINVTSAATRYVKCQTRRIEKAPFLRERPMLQFVSRQACIAARVAPTPVALATVGVSVLTMSPALAAIGSAGIALRALTGDQSAVSPTSRGLSRAVAVLKSNGLLGLPEYGIASAAVWADSHDYRRWSQAALLVATALRCVMQIPRGTSMALIFICQRVPAAAIGAAYGAVIYFYASKPAPNFKNLGFLPTRSDEQHGKHGRRKAEPPVVGSSLAAPHRTAHGNAISVSCRHAPSVVSAGGQFSRSRAASDMPSDSRASLFEPLGSHAEAVKSAAFMANLLHGTPTVERRSLDLHRHLDRLLQASKESLTPPVRHAAALVEILDRRARDLVTAVESAAFLANLLVERRKGGSPALKYRVMLALQHSEQLCKDALRQCLADTKMGAKPSPLMLMLKDVAKVEDCFRFYRRCFENLSRRLGDDSIRRVPFQQIDIFRRYLSSDSLFASALRVSSGRLSALSAS